MTNEFITRLDTLGSGVRVAVKDAIDVAGVPTTAGSRVVADQAQSAERDAACLGPMREAGVRIVGKTNLNELCFGGSGINQWFGTPVNPIDPAHIPGGSSSGSAVAVANGEADIALGTDTAGSIRNPAACCGVVGLKTTFGRISLEGVWPLAPSLDTVGPMATTVAGVVQGMSLLEPSFEVAASPARLIGRVRGLPTDPQIDEAVDRVLSMSEFEIVDIDLPGWEAASEAGVSLTFAESLEVNAVLVEDHLDELGPDIIKRFTIAKGYPPDMRKHCLEQAESWRAELAVAFERVELLALPTMARFPARLDDKNIMPNPLAVPVNLAGVPALAQPIPASSGKFPASLQLIGPNNSEGRLLRTGLAVELAVAQ